MLAYERVRRGTRATAERLLHLVGEPSDSLQFAAVDVVEFGPNHNVWGNRSRFVTGPVTIAARRRVDVGTRGPAATVGDDAVLAVDGPLRLQSPAAAGAVSRLGQIVDRRLPMRVLILHSRYLSGSASGERPRRRRRGTTARRAWPSRCRVDAVDTRGRRFIDGSGRGRWGTGRCRQ